jgi:dUTP pyrophosphatase
MKRFEFISKYQDSGLVLPERKTGSSAGFDFMVAEDILIPSYHKLQFNLQSAIFNARPGEVEPSLTLDEVTAITKTTGCKPTLVPTGVKCQLSSDCYLELSVRSSTPLKYWLILANGVGIIDADYYNNPDNEGHIYFQIINLAPFDIQLKKGDIIGQGIIKKYETLTNEKIKDTARVGGFGSTSEVLASAT